MTISENIILGARNQASKAFKDVGNDARKSFSDIGLAVKNANTSLTDFKSGVDTMVGALRTAYSVGKQAFDWGKQGAEVTQTTESFDGLMQRVGAAPGLLEELRKASRGTVDDLTLMSSTTTLVMGAEEGLATSLANATPQLLEMAKAANKLNPTLGSTTFLYESLATGIKRGSPMILDNLGITVRIEEANRKYAEALGKTAAELTSAEQKQALLNAVLESGQTLIEQAGGSADSAVDSYERLNTTLTNLNNTLSAKYSPAIAKSVDGLDQSIKIADRTGRSMNAVYWQALLVAIGFKTAEEAAVSLNHGIDLHADELAHAAYTMRDWQAEIDQAAPVIKDTQAAVEGLTGAQARNVAGYQMQALGIYDAMEAQDEYRESLAEAEEAEWGANQLLLTRQQRLIAIADAYLRAKGAQQELAEAEANYAKGVGEDLGRAAEQHIKNEGKRYEALKIIDEVMGTNLGTQYEYNKAIEEAVKAFDPENPEAFKDEILKIKEGFQELDEPLKQAQEKVDNLNSSFQALSGKHFTAYVDVVMAVVNATGGTGGGGGGEGPRPNVPKKRHSGGPMYRGAPYLVKRDEVMVPLENSYVLTQAQAERALQKGGGGPGMVVNVVNESPSAAAITMIQIERMRLASINAGMGG